jgi:hypothetical protein
MSRIKVINDETRQKISDAIFTSMNVKDEEQRLTVLKSALVGIFADNLVKIRPQIAFDEARRAWDFCRP